MQKFRKPKKELTNADQKVQLEYIQGQIVKTRDSVEDRQSGIARQIVNEVSGRKSTSKIKLKAACQEKKNFWNKKKNFKNLFENPPEITNKTDSKND